jgi:hypothetical protein
MNLLEKTAEIVAMILGGLVDPSEIRKLPHSHRAAARYDIALGLAARKVPRRYEASPGGVTVLELMAIGGYSTNSPARARALLESLVEDGKLRKEWISGVPGQKPAVYYYVDRRGE